MSMAGFVAAFLANLGFGEEQISELSRLPSKPRSAGRQAAVRPEPELYDELDYVEEDEEDPTEEDDPSGAKDSGREYNPWEE